MRLLVIEDNQALVANLFEYFEARGYTMDAAPDGESGLHLAATREYDAVILDWMLPRLDGPTVCERLRRQAHVATPIVMLTAKGEVSDKLTGFKAGADDYLAKPFSLGELEARIEALIRRVRGDVAGPPVLDIGDLTYDTLTHEIWRAGARIQLGPTPRRLLELLMRESPHVVARERLQYLIWGDEVPDADLLRSHMSLLRREIDRRFAVKLIHTVHGTGYRLAEMPPDA